MASFQSNEYANKHDSGVVAEPLATTPTNGSSIDVDEYGHLSLWQAIKKWNCVFWYSLAISSTILMFGYDFVIVGNSSSMPAFQYVLSLLRIILTPTPCQATNQPTSCPGKILANSIKAAG